MKNDKIDRLLRSAAKMGEEHPAAMPFGFDTRVVALWRAALPNRRWSDATASTRGSVIGSSDRCLNNRRHS